MLKFALRNLMSRPVRSLLALLGLTVAIAGMVGLFSVARGLDKMVEDTFRRIPGLTIIQPGSPVPLLSKLPAGLKAELAAVEGVAVVNPQIIHRANLVDGEPPNRLIRILLGTEIPSRLRLRRDPYHDPGQGAWVAGRFFTNTDRGTWNAVISRAISEQYGKGVGDVLNVDGYNLPIIGIYETGLPFLDVAILLDIERVREIAHFNPGSVSVYYVEQEPGVDAEELKERIERRFRDRDLGRWRPPPLWLPLLPGTLVPVTIPFEPPRPETGVSGQRSAVESRVKGQGSRARGGASSGDSGPGLSTLDPRPTNHSPLTTPTGIEVRATNDWSSVIDSFSGDLNVVLTILTGIGVTVAMLSIVNTMLMSVGERIIEFGILKANGWSPFDVMKLITFESATLGVFGGVLGAACGWGATQVVNAVWHDRVHLFASPGLLLFSVAFSTALGVLGGLYPAVWAMRMMPMDAIRRG